MFNNEENTYDGIRIDDVARYNMLEMGRWGKFLAIVGFIVMAVLILLGVVMMVAMPAMYTESAAIGGLFGGFLLVLYVAAAALYFYPTWALYKYSAGIKHALAHNDQHLFNTAFGHLKGAIKYIGIVTLVMLCIYAVIFLFAGLAALVAS
jgi:hypothetical protein